MTGPVDAGLRNCIPEDKHDIEAGERAGDAAAREILAARAGTCRPQ